MVGQLKGCILGFVIGLIEIVLGQIDIYDICYLYEVMLIYFGVVVVECWLVVVVCRFELLYLKQGGQIQLVFLL